MTNILIVKTMGHAIFSISHILYASGSRGLIQTFPKLLPENPENRKKIGQVALTHPVLFPEKISLCHFWTVNPVHCQFLGSQILSTLFSIAATLGSSYPVQHLPSPLVCTLLTRSECSQAAYTALLRLLFLSVITSSSKGFRR